MIKKKKSEGGANWMDTYGDMVTLLLCFFVLLYSMSTVSESKWKAVVMSFNPNAKYDQTEIVGGNDGPSADPEDGGTGLDTMQIEAEMEQMYEAMMQSVSSQNAQQQISVSKGNGYVFISFDDAVFFDGDSYVLRSNSLPILDTVAQILSEHGEAIDEIRVLGHTAQARGDAPNNPTTDRFLASNRATVVLVYLQEHSTVDPARMLSVGYGQWRPIAGNENGDERSKNRRVELIIAGKELDSAMGDSIEQYYSQRSDSTTADGVTP